MARSFAAKSDASVKNANMILNFAGYVATLPGILVGIMIAANLNNVYADKSDNAAFGVLLTDMMNKGGFSEFVSVSVL